ncbi:MAG: DNA primase regulatory subunit PriL [Methanosarcinales archaeon]|nr:MAG: DNA primase regulatory subunit PriL [Methanosarcinales archaeon]
MDVFGFAQFPYISGALKYVEALDFKLDELFFDRAFTQIRERGKERVISTIGDGITRQVCTDRTSAEKELLSYPVARILVSCINDSYLLKRYALAEAKSSYDLLKKLSDIELKDFAEEFDIASKIDEREFVIHFTDYIRHASAIHEHEWKLINRKMDHGWVHLSKEKFSRIIEEAIRKKIESGMPLDVPPDICTALEEQLKEIHEALRTRKSEFSKDEFSEIMPDSFPPCMAHALSGAQSGVNLSHSMRFALTSFLLNIGMDVEGIIGLFRVSPDFDEERTRYQVMHIHGATGTVYKSPSCDTMVTYGNCVGKEPLCERISHPLGYYRKKAWILSKNSPQKEAIDKTYIQKE